MPIFLESQKPLAELRKYENNGYCCGQCGAPVRYCWGGLYGFNEHILICSKDINHTQISREFNLTPSEIPGFTLWDVNKKRRTKLENKNPNAIALRGLEHKVALNQDEAMQILEAIWPKAPPTEKVRAAMLCKSYQLNPLMKHIFLVAFNEGKENESWATIMSIHAKRLISRRSGPISYIDDTPRMMSDTEVIKVYGKDHPERIDAIVRLRDPKTGAEVTGYGWWPKDKTAYGGDKGNSKENMAFIRAESQALDRLRPGEMPQNIEVVDENYVESAGVHVIESTGEIIEETPEPVEELIPEPGPEPPASPTPPIPTPKPEKKPEAKNQGGLPMEDNRPDEAKITKAESSNVMATMRENQLTASDVGIIMVKTLKWPLCPKSFNDLTVKQYRELLPHLKKKQ
jgi:hypothetical protein